MAGSGGHGTAGALADTATLQLFRLEALLLALEELTGSRRPGARTGRSLYRYTGAELMADVRQSDGLCRTLQHAARICGAALTALDKVGDGSLAIEIARLRDLVVALADLVEADLYRTDYPLEREHAFRELSILLGLSPPGSRRELLHACFGVGARIATRAIGALQSLRRQGG